MRDMALLSWKDFFGIVLAALGVGVLGSLLQGGPVVSTKLALGAAIAVPLCALGFGLIRRRYVDSE
jgi:hypothetical protein